MKFLITAGPTREPIDPVRFISNRSSGKMGYAIAEAALAANHEVCLITGPTCLPASGRARVISVTTSDEMADAFEHEVVSAEIAVMCAAVADFKPIRVQSQKLKKSGGPPKIELIPTRNFFPRKIGALKNLTVIGFAAETQNIADYAKKKLGEKGCDAIVANDVSLMYTGFESDENEVTIFFRSGERRHLARASKREIGVLLVRIFVELREKS